MNRSTANVVDSKVVELEFQNQQFESNAKQSLSTIERLKKALDFSRTGVDAGLKAIDAAAGAGHVSIGALTNGVGALGGALSNIGNIAAFSMIADEAIKAKNAVEGFIKSVTIDQVTAGWSKYAEKTSAVQTIMSATAKDWSDQGAQMEYVNGQLEKLNWFTDETSYNFLDMVNNIGKFTSNQVPLDKAVTAMQGISTWAAKSGANVGEASRAMYNLSQAIGIGSVKLMDWRSIENANMATAEFKETVIQTAESMGTLTKVSEGLWKTTAGNEVSVKNFNEHLKDEWFTSEVLIETLDKYGGFTDKLYKYMEEVDIDTTSKLLGYVEDFKKGTIDWKKAIDDSGVSGDRLKEILTDLGSEELEFGRKAFQAAQEAKTFQEAIDATKDAASTAWMNLFETMFGNYLEAKGLWTDLANFLYDVFVPPVTSLTELLQDAFGSTNVANLDDWNKFSQSGLFNPQVAKNLRKTAEEHGFVCDVITNDMAFLEAAVKAGAISIGDFQAAVESLSVSESKLSTEKADEDLKKRLEEGGEEIQNYLADIKDLSKKYTADDIMGIIFGNGAYEGENHELEDTFDNLLQYLGMSQEEGEKLRDTLVEMGVITDECSKNILEMSLSELMAAGYTKEQAVEIRRLAHDGKTVSEIMERIGLNAQTGADHWSNGLHNLMDIVYAFMEVVGSEWSKVFPDIEGGQIFDILEAFDEGTSGFKDWVENSEGLKAAIEAVANVFDLLIKNSRAFVGAALLKVFTMLVGSVGKLVMGFGRMFAVVAKGAIIFEALKGFITGFTSAIAPSGSGIANLITKFTQWLKVADPLNKVLNLVNKTAEKAGSLVGGWIDKFTKLPAVQQNVKRFGAAFKKVFGDNDKLVKGASAAWNVFSGRVKSIFSDGFQIGDIGDIFKSFHDTIVTFFSNTDAFKAVKTAFKMLGDDIKKVFANMGIDITPVTNLLGKLGNGAQKAFDLVKKGASVARNKLTDLWNGFKNSNFAQTAMGRLGTAFESLKTTSVPFLQSTWDSIKEFFGNIKLLGNDGKLSFDDIKESFKELFNDITENFKNFEGLQVLGDVFSSLFEEAKAKAKDWLSGMGFDVEGIIEKIKGVPSQIVEAFSNIEVPDWAQGIIDALQPVLDFFGIGKEKKGGMSASIEEEATELTQSVGEIEETVSVFDKITAAFERFKKFITDTDWGMAVRSILSIVGAFAAFKAFKFLKDTFGMVTNWVNAQVKKEKSQALLMRAGAIALLAASLYAISKIDPDRLWQSVGAIAALAAILGVLTIAVNKFGGVGKTTKNAGIGMLAMSASIILLVLALKGLEFLDPAKIETSVKILIGIVALLVVLGVTMGKFGGISTLKAGVGILAMTAAMYLMAGLIKILQTFKITNLPRLIMNLIVVVGAMALMLLATRAAGKNALGAAAAIAAIGAAMVLMSVALKIISSINENDILRSIIAITALSVLLAGLIVVTKFAGKGIGTAATIVALAGVLAVMAIALAAISVIKPERLRAATEAVAVVVGMLALLTGVAGLAKTSGVAILGLAAMVGLLAMLFSTLASIDDAKLNTISSTVIKIVGILTVLAGVIGVLGLFGASSFVGVGAILLLIGGLTLIAGALGEFAGKGVGKFLGGIGEYLPKLTEALGGFVDAFVPIVEATAGYTAESFSGLTALISSIGDIAKAELWDALGTLLFGDSPIEKFKTQMPLLAEAIGAYADALPTNIDETKVNASANALSLLADLAANKIPPMEGSVFAWLDGGTGKIGSFGRNLTSLATGLSNYANKIDKTTFNEEKIEASKNLATMIADLSKNSIKSEGLIGMITGGNSNIGEFAKQLPRLAIGLSSYAEKIDATNFNDDKIKASGNLAKMIAELSQNEIKSEGIIGLITGGSSNIGAFAQQLPRLAIGLSSYAEKISETTFSSEKIKASNNLAKMLGNLARQNIPTGGILGELQGNDTKIIDFAKQLPRLAIGLSSYAEKIDSTTFDDTKIKASENLAKMLAAFANGDVPAGGLIGFIEGNAEKIKNFGDQLPALAAGISGYANNLDPNLNADHVINSAKVVEAIASIGSAFAKWDWVSVEDVGTLGPKLQKLGDVINQFGTKFITVTGDTNMFLEPATQAAEAAWELAQAFELFATISFDGEIMDEATVDTFKESLDKVVAAVESLADINTTGVSRLKGAIAAIGESDLGKVIEKAAAKATEDTTSAAASSMSSYGESYGSSLASGINSQENATAMSGAVSGLLSTALEATKTDQFTGAGADIAAKLASGIAKSTKVVEAIKGVIVNARNAIDTGQFAEVGLNVGKGLAVGIALATVPVVAAAYALALSARRTIENTMKVKSPSRVTMQIGEYVGEGFAIGISNKIDSVIESSNAIAEAATIGLRGAIGTINSVVEQGIDSSPVIRPVLDLSEIQNGAGSIGSMLSAAQPISIFDNFGAISSIVEERRRAASLEDVVSALGAVNESTSNIRGGDTYNVNGITYDDGSNISDAIRILAHEVLMDRRR